MTVFTATFEGASVTGEQDCFEIVAPLNSRVLIREIYLAQYSAAGDANDEMLSVRVMRGHTNPGNGQPVTPTNIETYSRQAGAAVKRNSTMMATDGSPVTLIADSWRILEGWQYFPPRSLCPVLDRSERAVVRISAPAGSLTMNGTLVFEETGEYGPLR